MLSAKEVIGEISSELGMVPGHLQSIIQTAPIRYKVFFIPKRNGGLRQVAQPAREVKAIQRCLVERLVPLLPLHDAATAYRVGGSIKENASKHVRSNYMLKMDFRNFFPSISRMDVARHLEIHCGRHFDQSAIQLIAYVFTWAPKRQRPLRLCIGAPSSPLISNSIMFEFDSRLTARAESDGVTYTRYADDLTLSAITPGTLDIYPKNVRNIAKRLMYPRLSVNEGKTVFASRASRRIVTGVTLTADHKLSIGRKRKREIRAMYHKMILGELGGEEQSRLAGLIAFAEDIEPGFTTWLERTAGV